jgi:DNA-binding NarL/FixJ family response regulator
MGKDGEDQTPDLLRDEDFIDASSLDVAPVLTASAKLLRQVELANRWLSALPTAVGADMAALGPVVVDLSQLEWRLDEIGNGPKIVRPIRWDNEFAGKVQVAVSMLAAAARQLRTEVNATVGPAKLIPPFASVAPLAVAVDALEKATQQFEAHKRTAARTANMTVSPVPDGLEVSIDIIVSAFLQSPAFWRGERGFSVSELIQTVVDNGGTAVQAEWALDFLVSQEGALKCEEQPCLPRFIRSPITGGRQGLKLANLVIFATHRLPEFAEVLRIAKSSTSVADTIGDPQKLESNREDGLTPFEGGKMLCKDDRIEFCGIEICIGARQAKPRKLLVLLGKRETPGYSSEELAKALALRSPDAASSLVRRSRKQVSVALKRAGIESNLKDVILGGGPGYRLVNSISVSVHCNEAAALPEILAHEISSIRIIEPVSRASDPINEPVNSANEPILGPPYEPVNVDDQVESGGAADATYRQAAILHLLASGTRLRVPEIVRRLGLSRATVKREVSTLVTKEKIRFDGAPKSGGYVLVGPIADHADKRISLSTATTSASGPSADSR